jgi:hypothetical protein
MYVAPLNCYPLMAMGCVNVLVADCNRSTDHFWVGNTAKNATDPPPPRTLKEEKSTQMGIGVCNFVVRVFEMIVVAQVVMG